ncbi:putative beta-1,6-N-acetylglucosaminyltransferase [Lodderomyces elongisporus]|uniref:putative beta-1,6-N-acetylglucosaminyltransferase n=1 Tax=Lodderomyces elongisporus TaxID=36914 RepID=UPI002926F5C8|nr:putative beta-1,6-N-acetylglucosaminyltransferase [Lodderomyces elongisporus]WLF79067.1 putative beta-1,6-N-acetylglucosaminyltransferase [Lodderomyces elongisporus]
MTTTSPSRSNSTKQKLAMFSFGSEELASNESAAPAAQDAPKPPLHSTESCIFERDCLYLHPEGSESLSSLTYSIYGNGSGSGNDSTNMEKLSQSPQQPQQSTLPPPNPFSSFSSSSGNTTTTTNANTLSSYNKPFGRSRSSTHNSSISLNSAATSLTMSSSLHGVLRAEDHIPPCLDATCQVLNKEAEELEQVNVVYSSRRNSSVAALNMALGRPVSPSSRKNSLYNNASFTQLEQIPQRQQSDAEEMKEGKSPSSPLSPSNLSASNLKHSKSQVSFYSFAEVLNEESTSRRPMMRTAVSQGFVPTLKGTKFSTTPKKRNSLSYSNSLKFRRPEQLSSQSQLQSQTQPQQSNLSKMMVKKEGSKEPSEEPDAGNKSDNQHNDNASFISCSVADCLRGVTTEISGH